MDQHRLKLLFEKYQQGTLSPMEQEELNDWFHNLNLGGIEFEKWISEAGNEEQYIENRLDNFKVRITQPEQATKTYRMWPRIAAAASILLFLSAGGYFLLHKKPIPTQQDNQLLTHNIKPGTNKAILTLSNGQQINLNDAANGQLAKQNNTVIKKTADGKVDYSAANEATNPVTAIQYNTISTQRGGQWPEIKLPDGTKVKLDAASSVRYPVQFAGNERIVEVTGQAYFKVTYDKAHPFKVVVRGQTINDLGTEFNINAYDDEPEIRTTLVEGSVKVSKNNQSAILIPGQQAITMPDNSNIRVKEVDIDDVIAWKNGKTSFKNENIQEIMRQVSRWYDVDVEYQGQVTNRKFIGGVDRNANFSDLLKILEFNNVHVTSEGKKLIVKP